MSMQMVRTKRRPTHDIERKMNGPGARTTKKGTEHGRRLSTAGSVKDPVCPSSDDDEAHGCSKQVTLHDA